jgi:hypothetical protein
MNRDRGSRVTIVAEGGVSLAKNALSRAGCNMIRFSYQLILALVGLTLISGVALGCSGKAAPAKTVFSQTDSNMEGSARQEPADDAPVSTPPPAMDRRMAASSEMQRGPRGNALSDSADAISGRWSARQDPFGLIPSQWPPDIKLHREARIAKSGAYQKNGYTLVGLISPDKATISGVQGFYLELLSSWESIQVKESAETSDGSPILIIYAERPGARVEVRTEIGTAAFMKSL